MHNLVFLTLAALAAGLAPAPIRAQQSIPPDSVILCEHPNFAGYCEQHTLEPGMRHLLVRWPDKLRKKVSSIAVGYEVNVWVFEEVEFCGTNAVIANSVASLSSSIVLPYPWSSTRRRGPVVMGSSTQDWNDRLSSFIVYRNDAEPEGVLALKGGFGGIGAVEPCFSKFFPMPEPSHQLRRSFSTIYGIDNRASLLRISPAVEVVLFDHTQQQGASLRLPGLDVFTRHKKPPPAHVTKGFKGDLIPGTQRYSLANWYFLEEYQFADRAESLEVRRRGWNPAMEAPQRGIPGGDDARHRAPPAAGPVEMIEAEAMRPGPQGPSVVAPGRPVERAAGGVSREPDSNRPGHDYKSFPIPDGNADTCRTACAEEAACRAYTFVRPGGQGAPGHCWLKSDVSPPQPDACCVSGVKQ
jgi:hypothetical protein